MCAALRRTHRFWVTPQNRRSPHMDDWPVKRKVAWSVSLGKRAFRDDQAHIRVLGNAFSVVRYGPIHHLLSGTCDLDRARGLPKRLPKSPLGILRSFL